MQLNLEKLSYFKYSEEIKLHVENIGTCIINNFENNDKHIASYLGIYFLYIFTIRYIFRFEFSLLKFKIKF